MDNKEDKKNVGIFSFGVEKRENTPIFAETRADWIPYGDKNLYPDYLINLMNTSSKHNSLIKKKVNMTVGGGFKENTNLTEFFANKHGSEEANDIVFKQGYDLNTYGGYSMIITWSKDKKTISRLKFADHSKVRIAKVIEDESDTAKLQADGVDFFYISSDWENYRKEAHKPKLIQGFSEKYKDEATQLIHVNEYRAGVDYYTYPDYIASVDWIELDKEIANFHLSSVHNGFTPSMIISFRGGVPTEDEQKKLKKKLQKQYGGSDNASSVFVTFSEAIDSSPEFIPVNLNASDERFLQLEEQIQQNIIIAHGASPIVAGVAVSGKLGSSDEVRESEQMFQHNVIDAKQLLLERTYNKILKINGINETVELVGIKSFSDEEIKEEDTTNGN
ncbi:MAG: phage portal protein [Gammaproteobacteria bacterium]|nr:phage portal protein [Gammaproteobacteria bacterium]